MTVTDYWKCNFIYIQGTEPNKYSILVYKCSVCTREDVKKLGNNEVYNIYIMYIIRSQFCIYDVLNNHRI